MAERIYLTEKPKALTSKAIGLTDAKASVQLAHYKGQWLRISGGIAGATDWVNRVIVNVLVDATTIVSLEFSENIDRIRLVDPGEIISASGRIDWINSAGIHLVECEAHSILSLDEWSENLTEEDGAEWRDRFSSPIKSTQRSQSQAAPPPPPPPTNAQPERGKDNLPAAEYDRLGKAIAAGWGTSITEEVAWDRAKAIFPGHNVRKREFLAAFRRERGAKKPGKQASHQKL